MFSSGYYDCVGLVLAGKRFWAMSHYPNPGSLFEIDSPKERYLSNPLLPEPKLEPITCTVKTPEQYIDRMIHLMGITKYREREEDIFAIPFAGDETHLSMVVEALQDRRLTMLEPQRGHFSDWELGGSEGQLLPIPQERRILYHIVSKSKVIERRV